MMQQAIDIPTPSRADTETVITALETAAVFHAKGDGREAMRWLRRAAESAGAAGDDQRALSLSRVAADLHAELDAEPLRKATPPPPPSARSAPSSSSMRASHPPASSRPAEPAHPSAPPASASMPSAPATMPPAHSSTPPAASLAYASTPPVSHATGTRQAARVAIAISTTKAGFFEVRLLADGETPRLGSSEAMLIMVDPTSKLLAR